MDETIELYPLTNTFDMVCIIIWLCAILDRIIVDGQGSATVFNGPTSLLDAMYTSATNYITGIL